MKFNQFGAFGTILKGQELPEQDKGKINSYLMLRWLSGNQNAIFAQNEVNRFYGIPVERQYDMFRAMLHGKVKFIKYPKGVTQKHPKDLELIQKHYNVTEHKAMDMLDLVSKDELKYLAELYKNVV